MEAIKKDPEWTDIEADADPEKLWALVVQKHKVHLASEVEEIVKLSARQMYRNIRQGAYESIISYKERFNNALAVYNEQQNAELEDKDVAMDFFSRLDNGRYADFKATFLNGLTVKSITPPEDLNAMYSMISPVGQAEGNGRWGYRQYF
jgi:hypothetical protein